MHTTPTETEPDVDHIVPLSDVDGAGGGGPTVEPGSRWRWRVLALVALVVVVVAVVVWLTWPSSKPTLPAHAVISPTNANAVTTVGGQELLATLRKGDTATYHVAYKVVGDASAIGGALTLEVWQSPPQVREDTTLVQNGATTQTESFSSGNSGHLCSRTGSAAWQCQTIASSAAAASGPAGVLSSIAAQVSGNGVTTSKQTIDNNPVTCYTVLTTAKPKLCATSTGIPLSISDSEVSYQLVSLSENVSSSVFTLPTQG